MGTIEGTELIVYVCRCDYDSLRGRNLVESLTSELVFWMPLGEALNHSCLIENLRLIIPFCRAELMGWHITEKDGTYIISDEGEHEEANVS